MSRKSLPECDREFDFALIVGGVPELTTEVENALFEAGCDDATLSILHGLLYMEFSRSARSIEEAILSAIQNVRAAGIGAEVLRVDECNLVTQAEIARRIGRSRQLVGQYISGARGPGGFPPPEFYLDDNGASPLWAWCAVSHWFAENDILRPEAGWNAEVVTAINTFLETARIRERSPELAKTVEEELKPA
jgi:hypothetical protein